MILLVYNTSMIKTLRVSILVWNFGLGIFLVWVQYENLMKGGLYVFMFIWNRWIQYEILWNMAHKVLRVAAFREGVGVPFQYGVGKHD